MAQKCLITETDGGFGGRRIVIVLVVDQWASIPSGREAAWEGVGKDLVSGASLEETEIG